MSLQVGKLTKIKSRYKVVEDWQTATNEYKLIANWYRNYYSKSKPLPSKVGLALFAYLYIYKSKFSKEYRGKHIKIISESDDGNQFEILNTSNANPNDYDFRGQLIRMDLPLITYQNNVTFEVTFEKIPFPKPPKKDSNPNTQKIEYKQNDNVFIKGSVMERAENKNDDLVRIKITNFDKFISMNMENNENNTKSLIIELKKSEIISATELSLKSDKAENAENDDDASNFQTDEEENEDRWDSDYDSADPRYGGFDQGDPFISGEYYFIGIISNKVDEFDTDTNNYHLDGFGIDSATDYIYVGEGNNVVDTEELEKPWKKPAILNKDVVRCEVNMKERYLTFYKNGEKFGPKEKDYTISFNQYGASNKTWFPAVCIVNKNVKAVFKYL